MKSSILFFTALFAYLSTVQAYFYVPSFMNSLPFRGGMAFAQKNDSLYLFGGENATVHYTNDLYKLTQTSTSYTWEVVPQINPPNGTVYSQSYITADGENMVLLGGMSNTTYGRGLPLQMYTYNFGSKTWTAHPNNNANLTSTSPGFIYNRQFFSASHDKKNQLTYIFGGAVSPANPSSGSGTVFNDLHVLDANLNAKRLEPTPFGRYGHTASVLR
jgi:hypothetical protein